MRGEVQKPIEKDLVAEMYCVDFRGSRKERESIFNAPTTHEVKRLFLVGRVSLKCVEENPLYVMFNRSTGLRGLFLE